MKAFARDMFDLALIYVVGAVSAFGWFVFGVYVYLRPLPLDTKFGVDFNHDIGTALIGQGLIFFVTFIFAGVVRSIRGNKAQEALAEDRRMLRELYQWMKEQRKADAISNPSNLPMSSGNGVNPEGRLPV